MGELCLAQDVFEKRNRLVKKRRKKGVYGDSERPAAMVIAHTITPSSKPKAQSKRGQSPVSVISPPDASCVQARFLDSASFAPSGTSSASSVQPYLIDGKAAFASIDQAKVSLHRTIEKLKKESDNSSRCIGDLRAILATIEINLPKLKP